MSSSLKPLPETLISPLQIDLFTGHAGLQHEGTTASKP